MPWSTFLEAHWGAIAVMDFFKADMEFYSNSSDLDVALGCINDHLKRHRLLVPGAVCRCCSRMMLPA